jgi:hypothetical protein
VRSSIASILAVQAALYRHGPLCRTAESCDLPTAFSTSDSVFETIGTGTRGGSGPKVVGAFVECLDCLDSRGPSCCVPPRASMPNRRVARPPHSVFDQQERFRDHRYPRHRHPRRQRPESCGCRFKLCPSRSRGHKLPHNRRKYLAVVPILHMSGVHIGIKGVGHHHTAQELGTAGKSRVAAL